MKNKKPIGIYLLIVFFAWYAFRTIFRLFEGVGDIYVLNEFGLGWLGYIAVSVFIILALVLIYAYLYRKLIAYKLSFIFFGLNVIFTITVGLLTLSNLDIAKKLLIENRIKKGLPIENISDVSSWMVILPLIAYIIFYALLSLYVYKKRAYFGEIKTISTN